MTGRTERTRGGLLLDRDGVLIEDTGYLHRIEDIVEIPGALQTLADVASIGVPVAVVSNQSGVARGYYSEADVDMVHRELGRRLAALQAKVAFYYCPDHPTDVIGSYRVNSGRRKPDPGMLLEAARDRGFDPLESVMLGDRISDIEAGRRVGCVTVLLRTGRGARTEAESEKIWDYVFDSLAHARDFLMDHFSK